MPLANSLLSSHRHFNALRLFLILASTSSCTIAQEMRAVDTLGRTQVDTLRTARPRINFILFIGNHEDTVDSTSVLHSAQFLHSDAQYVGDLLWRTPGIFIRELGGPGQPALLSALGVDSRGISLQLDGRPMNDPVYRGFNMYDIPIEYLDEIEISQGSGSLFHAPSSVGGTLNVVTHQYDNVRPMTKIRFFQGPFEHILSDGIFAQNIIRNLNAMFGFQRHVTEGRFPNARYDSWNVRTRLRYNISDRFNSWASEFYNKSTIGLNGGVDPSRSTSLYDEVTAIVRDRTTFQTVARHDVTLGVIAKLLPDSMAHSKATIYYSSIEREFSTGGDQFTPASFSDVQSSSFWGTKLEQHLGVSEASFDLGGEFERRIIDQGHFLSGRSENYTAATARATLEAANWLKGRISTRFERLRGDNSFSWGLRLESNVSEWLSIWGDYSKSYRSPTIQELFWTDSTIRRTGPITKEGHLRSEFGIGIKAGSLSLSLAAFRRAVDNAIVFLQSGAFNQASSVTITSIPSVEVTGGTADVRLRVWNLEFAGNLTYMDYKQQGNSPRIFPRFASLSELSYRDQFTGSELDLKIAIRLKSVSRHDGLQFVPQLLAYAQQNSTQMPGFSAIDLYAVAKLGDAYLTLVWENPFNVNSMVVPFYPLMSRNIKLGVNWIFTD